MSKELAVIDDGMVLAQYGPMRLTIQAGTAAGPDTALARLAGEYSFTLLPRLAPARDLFSRDLNPFESLQPDFAEPLFNTMINAVRKTGLPELGPMAAVAGTVAEAVALYLRDAGATRAIVENGGDLSMYLAPGCSTRVGLRLGVNRARPSYRLIVRGEVRPLWGLASSGFGGRSLTQGIADTALCLADSGAVADAAATAVANHCLVESPAIKAVPAEVLDPETDIRGLPVIESIGDLTAEEIKTALDRALAYAQGLVDRGVIRGAIVSLRGETVRTRDFEELAAPVESLAGR